MAGVDGFAWAEKDMGQWRLAGEPRHDVVVVLSVITGGYSTEQRGQGREREVRWGNSPWVKRGWQRSYVRRWQVAATNDEWALPGGIWA